MVDILEALKQARLRSVKASISFSETRDKHLHQQAEYVKATVLTQDTEAKERNDVTEAANLYYEMLDFYFAKHTFRMPKLMNDKSIRLWTRVVDAAREVNMPIKDYLKAQFVFFHKAFGKPPDLPQLATPKAKERAKEAVLGSTRVVGNNIEIKKDIAGLLRSAEQRMQELCRTHKLSREDVYRKFVLTGLFFFPKEYLDADPIYKKVCSE